MRLFGYLLLSFFANLLAVILAHYLISGFLVEPTLKGYLTVAALITAANVFIRPIIKLLFTPLIIITLGFFSLVINGLMLLAIDFFSQSLTMEGLAALVYATLIITALNIVIFFAAKRSFPRN